MKKMKKLRSFWLIILSILLLSGIANAGHLVYFTGNLDGNQEVPPNSSTATGFGRVTLDTNTNLINVSVYYNNLSSGVTVGHIHGPATTGLEAGIVWNLNPTTGQTNGAVINALFTATEQNIADLFAGLMYFNIHTANFGGGELRGQIFIDSPYVATLDGNQENPNVSTPATGRGVVSLNNNG